MNRGACYAPFATLPSEVIVEILKEVDWRSLLNIRRTCTFLNALSTLHEVWISQHQQYVAQRMYSARPEKPLDSYSSTELERWVLTRRSADVGWKSEDTKYSRKRWVSQKDVWGTCLVPGGRWLLVGDGEGGMTTYDLDSPGMTARPLITPDDQDEPQSIDYISIELDSPKQSPNLSFTMAFSSALPHAFSRPFNIQFWQVALTGHSTEARLTAKYLSSIQVHDKGIHEIAMRKNILARIHFQEDLASVEIIDWKQSTSTAHCKAIILPGMNIDAIRLLPGDRLLAFSKGQMLIYDFFTARSGAVGVAPITEPRWKLHLPGLRTYQGALSKGLLDDSATYFVVKARNIHALVIPHDRNVAPHFRLLLRLDSPLYPTCAFGFERAYMQDRDRSIIRLNFPWDKGGESSDVCSSPVALVFKDYPTRWNGTRAPQMDEETGRVVQELRYGFWVIDAALVYADGDEVEEEG